MEYSVIPLESCLNRIIRAFVVRFQAGSEIKWLRDLVANLVPRFVQPD